MASGPIGDEPKQGAGSSDDSIGAVIVLALLFFTIFFVLGFCKARKEHSHPDYIKLFVIMHTRLVHSGDTNRLVYGPSNGAAVWMLDLKSNSASVDPMRELAMLESTNPKTIAVDSSLVQTFLGVWTVKDLITMANKGGDYRKIIAIIVGAGTGFYAGYLISDRLFPPRYDDPAIMKWLLGISDDYSENKRLSLKLFIKNREEIAKKSAQQIIDGDSDEKLRAYKLLADRLRDPKYVPSNEDFSVFAEVR